MPFAMILSHKKSMGKKYQNCIAFRTLHKSYCKGKIYEDKLNGNFCNGQNSKNDSETMFT